MNGFNLRRLKVRYSWAQAPPSGYESATIIERFGCDRYMFNFYNKFGSGDADLISQFLCYQDSAFGLKQFTENSCDYSVNVGISKNRVDNDYVQLYPNPASDFITMSCSNDLVYSVLSLRIKDLSGREIKQADLLLGTSSNYNVDISDLANGIYIISINTGTQQVYNLKLVKVND